MTRNILNPAVCTVQQAFLIVVVFRLQLLDFQGVIDNEEGSYCIWRVSTGLQRCSASLYWCSVNVSQVCTGAVV